MTLAALRNDATIGQKLTLAGPQAFTVSEVITLCERFANADADVTEVSPRNTPVVCNSAGGTSNGQIRSQACQHIGAQRVLLLL